MSARRKSGRTTGGVTRERIEAFRAREAEAYERARPLSRNAMGAGAEGYLAGVPMHWMRDWPMPFPFVVGKAKGATITDIDGNDYWVWRALERWRPQVVVIEYNPYYAPPERWVMKYDPVHEWDGSTYYGASLTSLCRLGKDKGYELICCDRQGNNAFFVEQSLYDRFGLEDNRPEVLYRPAMYKVRFIGRNTFVTGHPYRYGPGEER